MHYFEKLINMWFLYCPQGAQCLSKNRHEKNTAAELTPGGGSICGGIHKELPV